MKDLKGFTLVQPNDVPAKAGVFAIARYISKKSRDFEILHCDESEDIKTKASMVMADKKFDGFDQSIIYLVALESDPGRRSDFLTLLLRSRIRDK